MIMNASQRKYACKKLDSMASDAINVLNVWPTFSHSVTPKELFSLVQNGSAVLKSTSSEKSSGGVEGLFTSKEDTTLYNQYIENLVSFKAKAQDRTNKVQTIRNAKNTAMDALMLGTDGLEALAAFAKILEGLK